MRRLNIFAPAKINLYLHVTQRLDGGYHALDSLVNFSDIGDDITIEDADDFSFAINGPYAGHFPDDAQKANHESTNLVVRAVFGLAQRVERLPHFKVTLTKNLPLTSGIGGGSSNAAAIIWGLQDWWDLPSDLPFLPDLFLELGADVPVCYFAHAARIMGIGEQVVPVSDMPEMDIVLVNPSVPCPTHQVFSRFDAPFSKAVTLPPSHSGFGAWIEFLQAQRNDLLPAALSVVPEIKRVLDVLASQRGCVLHRLSGSGATCFGVFDNAEAARDAAKAIAHAYPEWWVAAGSLNRVERY